MKKILSILLFCGLASMAYAEKADSVGTRVKNGKVYILHKVEKGQGLYSISKKYGVKLSDIISENPGSEEVIKIDQIIWIPTDEEVVMEEPLVEDYFSKTEDYIEHKPQPDVLDTSKSTWGVTHTVNSGETLFSIARKYNTTVQVIKELNNLSSDVLSLEQKLLVPSTGDVLTTHEDYNLDIDSVEEELQIEVPEPDETIIEEKVEIEGYSLKIIRLPEYNLEKIEETGKALMDKENVPVSKNFAHHFNAPLGTVIMVTNPETNKTVFVKVTSNFTTNPEDSVIIKLSKLAAETIGLSSEEPAIVSLSYAR
ncbi:MAG: LysM peptidoglycan-binding domain-containing protein [Bacteroidia bacterium]